MKEETMTSTYQLISFLLAYPTEEHVDAMEDMTGFLQEIGEKSIKKPFEDFHQIITNWSKEEWIEHYIEVFDFGKTSNLYMTYLKLGEQKERGLELLRLKKYYEAQGYDVTDKELPDYLPIMLEFCSQVTKEVRVDLLEKYTLAIVETTQKLTELKSSYANILQALLALMKHEGIEVDDKTQLYQEKPLSLEDARIMQQMRDQLIRNQLG
ncbi:nitrate reductase molybdenum cofactor assembly chaperone [Gracilibacillus marinus]|jgi:nitrate reductase molybdenum cofactor assembly chaperone NarJ/NarW|uniref:Nitrate reductase molybdenum cofactor assembly chaperone n=1 Tax=Gracilibacillus marinus TaxID=630535 RepID=A0ABV8VTU9_9BACI